MEHAVSRFLTQLTPKALYLKDENWFVLLVLIGYSFSVGWLNPFVYAIGACCVFYVGALHRVRFRFVEMRGHDDVGLSDAVLPTILCLMLFSSVLSVVLLAPLSQCMPAYFIAVPLSLSCGSLVLGVAHSRGVVNFMYAYPERSAKQKQQQVVPVHSSAEL